MRLSGDNRVHPLLWTINLHMSRMTTIEFSLNVFTEFSDKVWQKIVFEPASSCVRDASTAPARLK